ncbi:MAG: hypothetical protein ACLPLR_20590 [Terriglobales bacterium]
MRATRVVLIYLALILTSALAAFAAAADQECLACHGEAGMKSAAGKNISINPAKHEASAHAVLSCKDCHTFIKEFPHPAKVVKVQCATCHADEAKAFPASAHSLLGESACASCHVSKAVQPIALRMVMEIATMMRQEFPGRSLSGIGGIETGGDAAQFILVGADTVQVCTGVMKHGYECVRKMQEELLAFMERHKFNTLADFKGRSLPYFTTHFDLVQKQAARKSAHLSAVASAKAEKKVVGADGEWSGDSFVQQSDALSRP